MDIMVEGQDEEGTNIVHLQMRRDLARIDMTLLPLHDFTAWLLGTGTIFSQYF